MGFPALENVPRLGLLQIVAFGFVSHEHAYLRDAWCQLDFVVVSLAWLPILFPDEFASMAAIRSMRALRPLRLALWGDSVTRTHPAALNPLAAAAHAVLVEMRERAIPIAAYVDGDMLRDVARACGKATPGE